MTTTTTVPAPRIELVGTPTAAEMLGINPDQFRRLAKKLQLEATDYYRNPHYRSGPLCPLWDAARIRALVDSPEVAAVKERARKQQEGRDTAPARREAAMAKRYQDYRQAIPKAAEALFSLNRYAKHRSCTRDHREEIYDLKNDFIRVLCEIGIPYVARQHTIPQEGKKCWGCNGTGKPKPSDRWYEHPDNDCDLDDFLDGLNDMDACGRCGGSGWYQQPGTRVFIAFRFTIGDQTYSWHQPGELVTWPVIHTGGESSDWLPDGPEKPVELPSRKFAEAKALIAFVIDRHSATTTSPSQHPSPDQVPSDGGAGGNRRIPDGC
jgi:hypothetical protein